MTGGSQRWRRSATAAASPTRAWRSSSAPAMWHSSSGRSDSTPCSTSFWPERSAGDGAAGGRATRRCVLGHDAGPVEGVRRLVFGDALGDLLVGEGNVEATSVDVERDLVALADRCDRAALGRLGGDVADHQAAGGAGEAAIGNHGDALPQPLADDRGGDLEHLAHSRTAHRTLVARQKNKHTLNLFFFCRSAVGT